MEEIASVLCNMLSEQHVIIFSLSLSSRGCEGASTTTHKSLDTH